MTPRAILIGVLLALGLVSIDYFNGAIIHRVFLIGNQLPVGVFGVAVLLLLAWNPLAGKLGKGWILGSTEVAVIVALALAVCGWPNFMRMFTTVLAMPSHLLKSKASWQSAQVMSYVPGGSPLLAEGYIRNWPGLVTKVTAAKSPSASAPERRVWEGLAPETRDLLLGAAAKDEPDQTEKKAILDALNDEIARPDFYDSTADSSLPLIKQARVLAGRKSASALNDHDLQKLNRFVMDATFPGEITPMPLGSGVLLADGREDPVAVDLLIEGSNHRLGLKDLPWAIWWPSLILWGGVGLFFALASGCLALIVHPQWTKRELLPYPIPRFIREVTQSSPGGRWPLVATSRLFWCGMGAMLGIHAINDLNYWFPSFITFPLRYDFSPLKQLFPDAARVPGADSIFSPTILPSIVAFAFFLSTEVSFSLGIMGFLYLAAGGILIGNGVSIGAQGIEVDNFSLMVFGAYVASTAMVLYVGRHYYLNVAGSAIGLRQQANTPGYVKWAARGLLLCVFLILVLLKRAGMPPLMSGLLIALILMIFFTVSRIYAETGALMVQTAWAPAAILLALFGPKGLGPTAYIVLAIAGSLLVVDTRETWMAYFVNGLQISETAGEAPPEKAGPWLLIVAAIGLVVTLCATFLVQYNYGLNQNDRWAVEWVPGGPFDKASNMISELSAHDRLGEATALGGLKYLSAMHPQPGALLWICVGIVLVGGCSFARLRFSWWPVHPVLFLVWGTWSGYTVTVSFFLGWLVKLGVMKLGGARSYHTVKPLMVGVIAGEVVAALISVVIGAICYFSSGRAPTH